MSSIKKIIHEDKLYAIIIYSDYTASGIEFFTPNDFSQQLGYMNREKGYKIQPHFHELRPREVIHTNEVLFVKSGKVEVCLYNMDKKLISNIILNQNDLILLAFGGHSFEMLEDTEIIEIKQGPYDGELDKVKF